MRMVLLLVFGVLVAASVYVRMAPDDIAAIHVTAAPQPVGDYPATGGFTAVRQITAAPDDLLRAVTQAALATDRTQTLAGTVDAGLITFITRSRLFGFPDYTTVSIIPAATVENAGPLLMITARLRYGKSDMGVNQARVDGWLAALGPLVVALDQDISAQ